jgi:hypothetical protein
MPRRAATAAAIAACCVALADSWILPIPLLSIPERIPSIEGRHDPGAIIELPLGDVERDLGAMYRSMYHGRPVVNGYGGFVPAPYAVLRVALDEGDVSALDALAVSGPLTAVVDSRTDDRQWSRLAAYAGAPSVAAEAGRQIFDIRQAAADEQIPSGDRLSIRSATASTAKIDLAMLTDGDPISRWDSGVPQRGQEWVLLDLGATHKVSGLTLGIGPLFSDYARLLAIDVSVDGEQWETAFEGRSAARAIRAAQRDPRAVPVSYAFAPVDARWIRLRQLGYSGECRWSIAELAVFGQ